MTDVLKKDVQSLQQLYTHITARLLTQDVQEENKHILLQEKAKIKWRGVIKSLVVFNEKIILLGSGLILGMSDKAYFTFMQNYCAKSPV